MGGKVYTNLYDWVVSLKSRDAYCLYDDAFGDWARQTGKQMQQNSGPREYLTCEEEEG